MRSRRSTCAGDQAEDHARAGRRDEHQAKRGRGAGQAVDKDRGRQLGEGRTHRRHKLADPSNEKLRRRRTSKGPGRGAATALFIEAPPFLARRAGTDA